MSLNLILGPMFAGKSTYLIDTIQTLLNNSISDEDKKNTLETILIINHSSDKRYSNESEISSHDKKKMPCVSLNNLEELFNNTNAINNIDNIDNIDITKKKYIFIDEGQFFNDLYDSVKTLLIKYKKIIYIGGLDGNYKQEPFFKSRILELIPYAKTVIKLNAKCVDCNNDAPFTKRIVISEEEILVGGTDSYKPVCLNHL